MDITDSPTKKCPECAEAIQAEALVCKHCGYDFRVARAPRAQAAPRTNGMAIASMVLGIVWIYGIGAILALVFGYKARREIDASDGAQTGRGMATAGIVLGWVGIGGALLVITLLVLAASSECVHMGTC